VEGPDYIALAIPFFFLLILIELVVSWRKKRVVYHFADAITDLACGVTQQVLVFFMAAGLAGFYIYAYDHWRLVTFSDASPWPWLIALFGVDVLYYWWHRLSHEVNFMWAIHVVHHSSEDFNLAVALRQAVLSDLTVTPFYLLLALGGVTPLAVFTVRSIATLYQFWIHTELIGKMGPVDRWMNTPSAHRVHHAVNPQYLDRNYAAMFMIWDRLFGSYEPEGEPCVYGISTPLASFNPIWAQTHYWFELFAVARRAPSLLQGAQVFFRSPAWHPPWIPEKPKHPPPTRATFVRFEVPKRAGLNAYVGVSFSAVVVATFSLLMWGGEMSLLSTGALAGMVVWSLVAWGALFEARPWAAAAEWLRLAALPVLGAAVLWRAGLPLYWASIGLGISVLSAVWMTRLGAPGKQPQPA
jgi:alkylglycerol monooxygenase